MRGPASSRISTNQAITRAERGNSSSRVIVNMIARWISTIVVAARVMRARSGKDAKRQIPR